MHGVLLLRYSCQGRPLAKGDKAVENRRALPVFHVRAVEIPEGFRIGGMHGLHEAGNCRNPNPIALRFRKSAP